MSNVNGDNGEGEEITEEKYNNFATDDEINPYSPEHQFKLTKALNVLHIKPSTFHSYYTSGKYHKAKQLLDKALKERMNMFWTTAYGLQKEKSEVGLPTLKETELTTIHEAFQFLNKTYIEKRTKLLSADQMRKNEVKFKKGQEIGVEDTKSIKSKNGNAGSIASRRGVKSAIARLETPQAPGPSASNEDDNDMDDSFSPTSPTAKLSEQLGGLFSSGMEPDPELDFMQPKLTRSKSRKSFRKKRDQEPYKLLRKGSDKIKAVNNFRGDRPYKGY